MSTAAAGVMREQLYKVLGPGQLPCYGGTGPWPPGKWRTEPGPLKPCRKGALHLCRAQDLLMWIVDYGEVWEAEARGEIVVAGAKVCCLEARITRKLYWDLSIARHFACDCAESVVHLAQGGNSGDCAAAIMLARAKAFGFDVPDEEMNAATSDASYASWTAWAPPSAAALAARHATRSSPYAARYAKSAGAPGDAQTARLLHYLYGGGPLDA